MMIPAHRTHLLWIGLLGLVVIGIMAMIATALHIERSLGQQVSVAIASAGYSRVNIEARGRDIAMKGYVSSPGALAEARRLAESVEGVRVVDARLGIQAVRLPWLRLLPEAAAGKESGHVLTGMMPGQEPLDLIQGTLSDSGLNVAYQVDVDPEVSAPDWLAVLGVAIEVGSNVEAFRMEIGAGEIAVGGRLRGIAATEPRLEALRAAAAEAGLRTVNRIAMMSANPGS